MMETILQVINKEFQLGEYEILDEGFNVYKHKSFADFWVLIECENGKFPNQDELYAQISEILQGFKEAEKNTSLLLLNKVDNWQEDFNEKVMSIENDPYFFKKYVITYTSEMEKQALDILGEKNVGANVSNKELFEQLKAQDSGENGWSLLYAIIHKLVFIKVPTKQEQFVNTDIDWTGYESIKEEIDTFMEVDDKDILKGKFKELIESEHNG